MDRQDFQSMNGGAAGAAWTAIGHASDAVNRVAAAALRPHGLTPSQYELLALLEGMRCGCCGEGECRCDASYICQNDIGERIATTKGNVSGIVQRLLEEGLISREPNPRNRRENAIRITAKGRTALFAARPAAEGAIRALFRGLTADEMEDLVSLLRRVPAGIASDGGGTE